MSDERESSSGDKTRVSVTESDGVRITSILDENGEVISSRFEVIEDGEKDEPEKKEKDLSPKEKEECGFFAGLVKWYRNLRVKPYAKIRDLADPFKDREDADAGSDGRNAAEIGIRVDF